MMDGLPKTFDWHGHLETVRVLVEAEREWSDWISRFGSFNTARRTIKGYEIMNMLRKGQVEKVRRGAVRERVKFIAEIFGVAA